jgi:large subunit ribosomal protein L19
MKNKMIALLEEPGIKQDVVSFDIGDQVDVSVRILEGDKERVQVFSGTVTSRRGEGMRASFTVRRLVQGEGVERIFPVNSPRIAKIEVKRAGSVRRAKLYYLRDRVGKATRIRERKEKGDDGKKAEGAENKE